MSESADDILNEAENASTEEAPRRRGRPPGSKNKSGAKLKSVKPELTAEEIENLNQQKRWLLTQILCKPAEMLELSDIDDSEKEMLIGAGIPVYDKYAPDLMDSFGPEITLLVVVGMVYVPRVRKKMKENALLEKTRHRTVRDGEINSQPGIAQV